MKQRKKLIQSFLICVILALTFVIVPGLGETKAASSYTNAKEFYMSTGQNNGFHSEAYNGHVYYATYGKLASSSTNLMYQTVGYDVTMEGGGQSVSFGVKRGGSLTEIVEARVKSGGYEYNLYKIPRDTLNALAMASNPTAAAVVLNSPVITVRFNAIITTKQYGELHGNVSEDGSGGLIPWEDVYHVNNASDLAWLKWKFKGHYFESYKNIECRLKNSTLSVRYILNGGTVNASGYSSIPTQIVELGSTVTRDMLYLNGEPVTTSSRTLNNIQLLNQNTIGLTKTGYHLLEGKEWTVETYNRFFSPAIAYSPTDICSDAGIRDRNICLYANWQPNTYTITYDANGGAGYMHTTEMTYDEVKNLRKNGYTRNGYSFNGWNTARDGSGTRYEDQKSVSNLTTVHNGNIVLYAQWEPLIFTITTDKQGGSGGTDRFYEQYATGWYQNPNGTGAIQSITIPQRIGYEFLGYHKSIYGLGDLIVSKNGSIAVNPDYFTHDSLIYANWKAKEYTITFDKQGGYGGTDSVKVLYGTALPTADAPVRTGYSFMGYYTAPNGAGEKYYNEFMAAEKQKYEVDGNMTLYAYWVDDVAPTVNLTANYEVWTNQSIVLEADASDTGSGLESLTLYMGSSDTPLSAPLSVDTLNRMLLYYTNEPEGVIRYRAVAKDKAGNETEVFKTIYSDTTAPKGTVTYEYFDGYNVEIEIFVDDWKVE